MAKSNFWTKIINGVTVSYSYSTPIAVQRPGEEPIIRENTYSRTTARHMGYIDKNYKKKCIGSEDFKQRFFLLTGESCY